MGVCVSLSNKRLHHSASNTVTQPTIGEFYPPPNLLRKSSQSPLIKEQKDLFQCVSGYELNEILEQGGNIESNLSVFISSERVRPEKINQTNMQLLEQIAKEGKNLSSYKDKTVIEKALNRYESEIIENYGELIRSLELWNKAESSFCVNILFQATEIYQVLLSFKKKNKHKKLNYWWLPPLVNFSDVYDESDSYHFLKKKIDHLGNQLKVLFTSTLGINTESKEMKKESCMIENSDQHQAAKCKDYNITKKSTVSAPRHGSK